MYGLGFRVEGLGFWVQGVGLRVEGLGFRDEGLTCSHARASRIEMLKVASPSSSFFVKYLQVQ